MGTPQSFTVTVRDAYGNTATGYTGTITFTSSDAKAVLPANYTFTSTDVGKHTFSATLNTTGAQSITATDTVTATITGTESGITVNAVAAGATYYVSLTGSDSNAGTLSQPFATIKHGASVLKPGDTLYVRAGTYAEELVDAIPGGTSWTAPVTVAAYPGETVILRPNSSSAEGILYFAASSEKYIIVKGITIDATHASADAVKITWSTSSGASNHIRLQADEIENTPNGMGVLVTGDPASGNNVDYNESLTARFTTTAPTPSSMDFTSPPTTT